MHVHWHACKVLYFYRIPNVQGLKLDGTHRKPGILYTIVKVHRRSSADRDARMNFESL